MPYLYHLSFKQSVSVKAEGEDVVLVNPLISALRISKPTRGMQRVIEALCRPGGQEDGLCELMVRDEGLPAAARFYYYLGKFDEKGFLCRTVPVKSGPLATLAPVSRYFRFEDRKIVPGMRYVLSRFAYCRREGGEMVLESPLGHGIITLSLPESLAIIQGLAQPATAEDMGARIGSVALEEIRALFNLLLNIEALQPVQTEGIDREDEDPTLAQWEFHDLLFYTRSRKGRHDQPSGGTYRFRGKFDPLPAMKPRMAEETISLYRPDLDFLKQNDLPFTAVLEARRSIREYSQKPLSAKELGEFLFRAARVRKFQEADPQSGHYHQTTDRPYPGGGAVYELELYPVINDCAGIEPGLYHYDPFAHELVRLSGPTQDTERLIDDAYEASGLEHELGALIIIAARFQRFSWKYASMAYSVILKNVGVLLQNMYLVATAMGLAPCALGSGDSDLFAQAAGINYLAEASVGEFILGKPA